MKKRIRNLPTMKITSEGKEMLFRDFVQEVGGSGTLYEKDIREIFNSWKAADFAYVDDYIAPIAAQVIVDACEIDRSLYEKIMTIIDEAYRSMRPDIDPNHPGLFLIK